MLRDAEIQAFEATSQSRPDCPMIRTLVPMAADKVGPSRTCAHLASGIHTAGGRIEMMVNRVRGETSRAKMLSMLPGPLALLPYRHVAGPASRMLEAWYLRRLRAGEVAWLWPSVSLATHEAVARRGNPIVLEGINSRMGQAKEILDAAYDAFGTTPNHDITAARIAEEDAKYALADTIFAPNALVEQGLTGTGLADRFLPTSYGVDTSLPVPARKRPRPTGPEDTVIFMFCGYACVRKGVHHLLEAWKRMPSNAVLRLVGGIESVITERYGDLLASDKVDAVGFTHDVPQQYVDADVFVFPSLEEGGPQVCYEAAHFGLPSVVSDVGGGRLATDDGIGRIVDPVDIDAFEAALMALHVDADLRAAEGAAAAARAPHYDWMQVGARRLETLTDFMAPGLK